LGERKIISNFCSFKSGAVHLLTPKKELPKSTDETIALPVRGSLVSDSVGEAKGSVRKPVEESVDVIVVFECGGSSGDSPDLGPALPP
jgi:hypothetical protein